MEKDRERRERAGDVATAGQGGELGATVSPGIFGLRHAPPPDLVLVPFGSRVYPFKTSWKPPLSFPHLVSRSEEGALSPEERRLPAPTQCWIVQEIGEQRTLDPNRGSAINKL